LNVLKVYDLRMKRKVHERGKTYLSFKVSVKLLGLEEEIRVEREYDIPIVYEVCDNCIKRSSGYYESVLRFKSSFGSFSDEERETILREVKGFLSDRGGTSFIAKYEKKGDIMEFKLSSNSSAKSIASLFRKKYGAKVRIDSKLHTRREGKNFYRLSILVEISPKSLRMKNP
ncbi:MAG: NMD3-related protein, partial [Candidatus Asgardarchaeia archaeon]